MISLDEAHQHIRMLEPLPPVSVALEQAVGLVCGLDICAATDCPSVDSSLKDGFAVISSDIADASPTSPVALTVAGSLTAGDDTDRLCVEPGEAVRIMTGAAIPSGATAVLASEFTTMHGKQVLATADAHPGRNILKRGSDIMRGRVMLEKGTLLTPSHLGLLAAAGVSELTCIPAPRVAIAATGSELVAPGEPVTPGKVAASNMVTAAAELRNMGIAATTVLLRDHLDQLQETFAQLVEKVDVLITCGGVLDGDKDLTMRAMEAIGMKKIFHRVRIGPGKGACLGRVGKTVVFNLPGGPPSNHVALLLLALPGIRRLMGVAEPLPPRRQVMVTEEHRGQKEWTQLIYSTVIYKNGSFIASQAGKMSRFQSMAAANGLVEIPEGCTTLEQGSQAGAWFFR